MPDRTATRRLRAAVRYAMTWGAGWFALGLGLTTALQLAMAGTVRLADVLGMAIRFAVIGSVAGFAFAGFIGWLYRGRRLTEMSPLRIGLGGALVTGLFVPSFLQTMNILSGTGPIAWSLVLGDGALTAVLGGLTAGLSVLIAQHARGGLAPGDRAAVPLAAGGEAVHGAGGVPAPRRTGRPSQRGTESR